MYYNTYYFQKQEFDGGLLYYTFLFENQDKI